MDVLTIIVKTTLNSGIVLAYHQGSAHTGRQQPALNFFYQHPNMPPPPPPPLWKKGPPLRISWQNPVSH